MNVALAVIGLLGALVPLLIWWVKRKQAPTPAEQIIDLQAEYERLLYQLEEARARGDHAGADAILRRLQRAATCLYDRQRDPADPPRGVLPADPAPAHPPASPGQHGE